MDGYPFIMADSVRAEQFRLIGHTHRHFLGYELLMDAVGVAWAYKRVGANVIALTWLGRGWVFDPPFAEQWSEDLAERRKMMKKADADQHRQELQKVIDGLRLGRRAERLLWAVVQAVRGCRSSVIRLPYAWFFSRAWGQDETLWPKDHRQHAVMEVLRSLSWLHVAEWEEDGLPPLGAETALISQVADLRGTKDDVCADGCPDLNGPPHHHIQVNIGRGLLGVLEQFAHDEGNGMSTYRWAVGKSPGKGKTKNKAKKTKQS